MKDQIQSPIANVSSLAQDQTRDSADGFDWWGPSPEQARKTTVGKPKGLSDKTTTIKEAVHEYVKDGISQMRLPMTTH